MAGTINLSMSQQFDEYGKPLSGGLLYLIEAGTTATPQSAYQDSDLTIALPNPITLDAAGRIPQFYLADGQIKVRLTDASGVQQLVADNLLVIGPSSGGGGGGGGVDATTVLATGDFKARYGTGALAGFVRANGRTIGSATSGAAERANADTQALFEYLWGADSSLSVSGGRGSSANDDWTANKTLTLPDLRGRLLAGLDDMGNTSAGRLTPVSGGVANSVALGSVGGTSAHQLLTAHLPSHYHSALISDPGHVHSASANLGSIINGATRGSFYSGVGGSATTLYYDTPTITVNSNTTGIRVTSSNGLDTTYSTGSDVPHNNVQPTMVVTYYIKL